MDMTRDQLTAFYLVFNRKELLKRELLNMGVKARTIHSLADKELFEVLEADRGQVVRLTVKALVFESQMRILEAKNPNTHQEGFGTYMMRLAKKVDLNKKEAPLKLENRAIKMLFVVRNVGSRSVDVYRSRGYYVDTLPLLQRSGLVRIPVDSAGSVYMTDKGRILIQELNNAMNGADVIALSRQGNSDEEILELKVSQVIEILGYKEAIAG